MLPGLAAALGAALVFGVAAVVQAIGARQVPTASNLDPRLLVRLLRRPMLLAAIGLNFVGFVLHLIALRLLPLYLAQAGIAASLVVTAALAVRLFDDRLSALDWAAVVAVAVGLGLLVQAAAPPGEEPATPELVLGLAASLVVIALAGALALRSASLVVPAVLGGLAGLGFAIDSVAIRLLPGLTPAELWDAPTTYVFLVSAVLGFLLYSIALQRGAVAAATAPLIVAQTIAPAAVGVVLLGDSVREGWLAAAVLGLTLTTAGAAKLARFEGGPQRQSVSG